VTSEQAGAAIRARREELKLSMRAAAVLAGVSPTAWSDLEAGKHPPTPATQRGVCAALGWKSNGIDRLLAGKKPQLLPSPPDELAELRDRVAKLERSVGLLLEVSNARGEGDEHWPRRSSEDG
jgi:transcriptional regulator with XRE-family HTH domain